MPMKKILITGANSYVGMSFENHLLAWTEEYEVDTVDMIGDAWLEKDFGEYDVVYHVAGIAHSDNGKISKEKERLYYSVNTDLAIKTAKKAKADGVGQFIYMSSAIVYGDSAPIGQKKVITKDTPVAPANCYGDSKVQAEKGLLAMSSDEFKVVIIRSPMIYGKGSRGNYPLLSAMSKKLPFFPYVENERSMIYIENLCEFVRLMIENAESGIFWPQNERYSNTSEIVVMIAKVHNKRIFIVRGMSVFLKLASHITGLVNKAFGSLCYDMEISDYKENYRRVSMEESIEKTERE